MARSSDSFFLIALFKDKTFQMREIRRVIAFATLYLVITTLMLAAMYHYMLGQLVSGNAPMLFVSEDMNMLNDQIPSMASVLGGWIVMMLIVNVIVTGLISMYIIRKLGQPLMAVKRALREMADGNLNVRLRADDDKEFAEVSHALQDAVVSINRQIAHAKGEVEWLQELQAHPDATAGEVEESVQSCRRALDFFETARFSA